MINQLCHAAYLVCMSLVLLPTQPLRLGMLPMLSGAVSLCLHEGAKIMYDGKCRKG